VRYFSIIATPLNDLMKKGVPFYCGAAQEHFFNTLIDKLTYAPLLQLPDFGKTFELEYDTSEIEIGGVLLQEGKHIAYFSEKLSPTRTNKTRVQLDLAKNLRTIHIISQFTTFPHFGPYKAGLQLHKHSQPSISAKRCGTNSAFHLHIPAFLRAQRL
jgi:hypothetical protein